VSVEPSSTISAPAAAPTANRIAAGFETLWPAPRGRIDDWSASAPAAAVPPGRAPYCPEPVTLTARSFMSDTLQVQAFADPWRRRL